MAIFCLPNVNTSLFKNIGEYNRIMNKYVLDEMKSFKLYEGLDNINKVCCGQAFL